MGRPHVPRRVAEVTLHFRRYWQLVAKTSEHTMKSLFAGIGFWVGFPFVMARYYWKRHCEWKRIVPRIWRTSGEILSQDLEMYDDGRDKLGKEFISDFAVARNELLSLIKRQLILSGIVFAYLLSNYFKVGLDINIGGFSLRYAPGVPEALLLVSNLLACYTIILQSNCYLIESAIKTAIALEVEPELRNLYLVRYFPHEYFGAYQPFNLPHIVPNRLQRGLVKGNAILFLLMLILTALAFSAANFYLLLYYLWLHPNFGIWSHVLLAYILVLGLGCIIYVILTRIRVPFWTIRSIMSLQFLSRLIARNGACVSMKFMGHSMPSKEI